MTQPNQSATETPRFWRKARLALRVLSHELFLQMVKISWLFLLVLFTSFLQWVALVLCIWTYSGQVWNLVFLRKRPKVQPRIKVEIHSLLIHSYAVFLFEVICFTSTYFLCSNLFCNYLPFPMQSGIFSFSASTVLGPCVSFNGEVDGANNR